MKNTESGIAFVEQVERHEAAERGKAQLEQAQHEKAEGASSRRSLYQYLAMPVTVPADRSPWLSAMQRE